MSAAFSSALADRRACKSLESITLAAIMAGLRVKGLGRAFMRAVAFKAGDVIIREGDEGDAAYFIVSGEVEVLIGSGGRRLGVLGAGEVFGEMCLIEPGPRSATVSDSWSRMRDPPSSTDTPSRTRCAGVMPPSWALGVAVPCIRYPRRECQRR